MRTRGRLALATVITAAAVLATPAPPARAATCAQPGEPVTQVSWAQQSLAPERAWPFSTGEGITVAVLSSGVDGDHRQLLGRVDSGYDAVAGGGTADADCRGTGTQVAGVIVAQPVSGTGFAGFAPGVRILPIRVVHDDAGLGGVADPDVLAGGIDAALDRGADVIAVPVVADGSSEQLRSAVQRALQRGITVVAAVGDLGAVTSANPTPYPAAYPGVIGVGAIDPTGMRWSRSQHGEYVDLMAPGVEVLTLQSGSGMVVVEGTAVACGFVAAAAALVRARRGSGLAGEAVSDQLVGTAIPTAAGEYYGRGIVNPYAAVTNAIVDAEPAPLPALPPPFDPDRDGSAQRRRDLALAGAGLALLATVAAIVLAVAVPRGRRRFWRSTLARPSLPAESGEPGPPIALFEESAAPKGR